MDDLTDEPQPLRREAEKRKEWRGDDGNAGRPESGGGTLPASEDDDERMKSGSRGSSGSNPLRTILPPD